MSADDAIIDAIIAREGDFVDHPADRGGATRWGVTQATLSESLGRPATVFDVRALVKSDAAAIYRKRYLQDTGIWKIPNPELRAVVLDAAVNHGPATAIRMLQHVLYLDDDGVIGQVTLAAIPHLDPWKLIAAYTGRRCKMYGGIVANDASQRIFAAGWFNRIADLIDTVAKA